LTNEAINHGGKTPIGRSWTFVNEIIAISLHGRHEFVVQSLQRRVVRMPLNRLPQNPKRVSSLGTQNVALRRLFAQAAGVHNLSAYRSWFID
jgi:hypothetical protein